MRRSVVFVDRVTLRSLFWLARKGLLKAELYAFEPCGPLTERYVAAFVQLGLMHARPKHFNWQVADMCQVGALHFKELWSQSTQCVQKVWRESVQTDYVFQAVSRTLPSEEKAGLALHKGLHWRLFREFNRVGLTHWAAHHRLGLQDGQALLLISRNPWIKYLRDYGKAMPLDVEGYRSGTDWPTLRLARRAASFCLAQLKTMSGHWTRKAVTLDKIRPDSSNATKHPAGVKIALHYFQRKLSLDGSERSEFFWALQAGPPLSSLVLADYNVETALPAEQALLIKSTGIRLFGSAPDAQNWRRTSTSRWMLIRGHVHLAGVALAAVLRGHKIRMWVLAEIGNLLTTYTYWLDFYSGNNIRICIDNHHMDIGRCLAMDKLGGVSLSYQLSVSMLWFSLITQAAGTDVQFVCSPLFEAIYRQERPWSKMYVPIGYPFDVAIAHHAVNLECQGARQNLERGGAKFVVAYFDENYLPAWYGQLSQEQFLGVYRAMFQWVIDEPDIGLLVKPKIAVYLEERLAPILGIWQQALATGRLHIFWSQHITGEIYPSQIACAADLCVGELIGSTAAMEAAMVGTRSVLVDPQNLQQFSPFDDEGRVVFKDVASLRQAVSQHRQEPETLPGFGDWTERLERMLPAQDGRGTRRMGTFIAKLHEQLNAGADKDAAIAYAFGDFRAGLPTSGHGESVNV